MLGLPTSPRTWCSLIAAAGAAWPQTKRGPCPTAGLGGFLIPQRAWAGPLFGCVWEPVSGGASVSHPFPGSPYRMPAPLASGQALLDPAAFVFSDSCHQGGSPRLPLLPSRTSHSWPARRCCASPDFTPGLYLCCFWAFFPMILLICYLAVTSGIYSRGQLLGHGQP